MDVKNIVRKCSALTTLVVSAVLSLVDLPAAAQSNVVVRVMAANITSGNFQRYETPGLDIFKGLKPDVVAIQEFNYASMTTNGINTAAAFREMIDTTFGTNFVYFRESGYNIPNGVISRYPIIASGSWDDTSVSDRGFAWAQIDLPGTNDLYIVSVHLLTSSATARDTEASNLTTLVQANFPANAWIIVAGDFNTDSRSEACMTTFGAYLSDNPIPVDNNGNSNTSINRNHPHDYLLPSFPMTNTLTSLVLPSNTFPNGLVFDSRVYTPLTDVPPVIFSDSGTNGMQHMPVLKDFLVPVVLASGASLSVSPAAGLTSIGHVGGPFTPTTQTYTIANSGNSNLNWSASNTANWVTLSATSGTLAPASNTSVAVSINANANALSVGSYSDTVIFTNTTNGAGSTTRSVSLTVNAVFPVIVTNGYTLTAESCPPTNGVVDPGETVTINLSVKNTGTANTSNLVATLVASSDVISPSSPQTYGVVSTNGTPVSQPFSFTAGGTCGGVIAAMLQLQDGAANLGTISYSIPLGLISGIFTQNFDSVIAPSLPAGWTTSASGAQSSWITSTTSADTVPNAAFSPDPGNIGVNEIDSPSIAINSGAAQLRFRHNYSLTASAINSATGFDGGVLEIKIGSGSYTDIVAAGGSFVTGGYNRTLSPNYSNPLGSRQAWSGTSAGFTTTVVNLPTIAAGQNVQLRWRCASGTNPPPVTSSGTLAYWNFDGSTPQPTVVMTGVTASAVCTSNTGSIQYFGGNPGTGQAIATTGFSTSAGPPTTTTSCFTASIVVTNGSQASLSSISFDDQRSSTGPANFSVQISQAANFLSLIYDSGQQTSHTSILSGANNFALTLSNLTGTIYFRLYGYAAGASGGTWRIDNLNIQGTVTGGGTVGGSGWYVDTVTVQDVFCCSYVSNPLTPFQIWQIQYFGSTNNPAAADNVDADGDGQSNLAEFSAGTDPTNSVSALRITSITKQGSDVLVAWTLGAGKTNALQVTSGGTGGSYATNSFVDLFIVTNTVGTVTNAVDVGGASSGATRYYRVRLVP